MEKAGASLSVQQPAQQHTHTHTHTRQLQHPPQHSCTMRKSQRHRPLNGKTILNATVKTFLVVKCNLAYHTVDRLHDITYDILLW